MTRQYDVGVGFANEAERANAQAKWATLRAQQEDNCRGIDALDVAQRLQWLERAAAGGDEPAQTHYLQQALNVLTDNSGDVVRNAEAIVRAKSDGMGYLEQAAARGNTEALIELALEYRTNMVVPRDDTLSLGYAIAVQRAGLDPIIDRAVNQWRANMTEAQIAQAEAHAQRIYASCCAP
jgi:TPR repeat protein